jgi:hypothetical protein
LGDALVTKLDALERDASISTVAVVTHVPLLEEQMERRPHDPTWGLCNAYFGNLTLGRRVTAFRKVRAVVSGHTHAGRRATRGAIDIRVVDSDYGAPSYEPLVLAPSSLTRDEASAGPVESLDPALDSKSPTAFLLRQVSSHAARSTRSIAPPTAHAVLQRLCAAAYQRLKSDA